MKTLSAKQKAHLQNLHELKRQRNNDKIKQILSYDIDFYKKSNGSINIAKLSRCSGFSRQYLSHKLWQLGLL